MIDLRQSWAPPSRPRPIVIVGAGAVVRTAHLPAYRRLGLPVAGLFDVRPDAARQTAGQFGVETVFGDLAAACATREAVFDVAVPADEILGVLRCLPAGAPVLIQKPMGEDLAAARRIVHTCRDRGLVGAMNFQLRFSPNVLAVRQLVTERQLGELTDLEVRVVDLQPWQQWPFLRRTPRLEVLYHSIHYLDTLRWLAGEPAGVHCRAVAHPEFREFRDTRSTIILDYGDRVRCSLTMNHAHRYGPQHRASTLTVEGTRGAVALTMGVNLDYPAGPPDSLEVALDGEAQPLPGAPGVPGAGRDPEASGDPRVEEPQERASGGRWRSIPLRGSWFTEAFEGPMSNLQRFVAGEDAALVSPLDDALRTMALVEACYESSAGGATPIPAV
jgi:predicted dehydrogenase